MKVKVKTIGSKNERRVVGWDGIELRRLREGDEFNIPDDEIEVDEVIEGQKTGKKVKKFKFFSSRWMEPVEGSQPVEVVHRPRRQQAPKATGDQDLI